MQIIQRHTCLLTQRTFFRYDGASQPSADHSICFNLIRFPEKPSKQDPHWKPSKTFRRGTYTTFDFSIDIL